MRNSVPSSYFRMDGGVIWRGKVKIHPAGWIFLVEGAGY
jgi:hypothetical protein